MERVPWSFHERAVPTTRPEPLCHRLERWPEHTDGKSFGMTNELLTLEFSFGAPAAKVRPSCRPLIEHVVDFRQCIRGLAA